MPQITFPFEELPLIVDLGTEAGLVNGTASIHVHKDGEWFVNEIFLDGYHKKYNALGFDAVPVEVERRSPLFSLILDQLENGKFKNHIVDAVANALEADDVRVRSDRGDHSTLNRAQQGI